MKLATVKIKDGDDYAVINETDFDPKEHKLFGGNQSDGRLSKADARAILEAADVEIAPGTSVGEMREMVAMLKEDAE